MKLLKKISKKIENFYKICYTHSVTILSERQKRSFTMKKHRSIQAVLLASVIGVVSMPQVIAADVSEAAKAGKF